MVLHVCVCVCVRVCDCVTLFVCDRVSVCWDVTAASSVVKQDLDGANVSLV